jgi:hypothetical protein
MIRINDVHSIRLIAQAAQIEYVPRLHHCIATYDKNDKLAGGVIFTNYLSGSVQIHMAGFQRNWVNKAILYLAFNYPFVQLGVKKLFGLVPERNIAARNNDLHLGFKIEYLTHDVFNYDDGVNGMYLVSMYRQDCKWLKMRMPFIEYAPDHMTGPVRPIVPTPEPRWIN